MQCLRCGKDTGSDAVFCAECQATMEDYPVPPGTPVVIPTRPNRKAPPRPREISHEEQIARLQQRIRRLSIAATVLATVLAVTLALFIADVLNHQQVNPDIGRNYRTVESTAAPGGE